MHFQENVCQNCKNFSDIPLASSKGPFFERPNEKIMLSDKGLSKWQNARIFMKMHPTKFSEIGLASSKCYEQGLLRYCVDNSFIK